MPMPIPPKLSAKGAAALDELLKTSVEGRTVPATYFGATTADGPLYFNCAGERVFGEPDKGEVTEGTSERVERVLQNSSRSGWFPR
jgi:hypothetical protein